MSEKPLISVITPCLNRASMVGYAIESVLAQDYPQVEHLIMDGGSTDGTLDILMQYPHLRVTSQPDRGMYDAINKGIQAAKGEVIGLLNTDDFYAPNIFKSIIEILSGTPTADALVGKASWCQETSNGIYEEIRLFPEVSDGQLLYRSTLGTPIINAWFFRKKVFSEIGNFNIWYLYSADREFLIRFALQSKRVISVDKTLYYYRCHPDSATFSLNDNGEAPFTFEDRAIAEEYLRRKDLDKQVRKVFIDWHSQSTSDQCASALRRGAVRASLGYSYRGMRFNIFWPVKFFGRETPRAIRLFKKNLNELPHKQR